MQDVSVVGVASPGSKKVCQKLEKILWGRSEMNVRLDSPFRVVKNTAVLFHKLPAREIRSAQPTLTDYDCSP